MEILNQGQASVRKQSSRIKQNACFSYFLWNHFVLPLSDARTPSPPFLKSTSFILKLPFWFGSILKIYIKGPDPTIWFWNPCSRLFPECGCVSSVSSPLSCISIGQHLESGVQRSLRSLRVAGADLHIPTWWNHIILMRMQMKGTLWEMALDELLVKNVLLGRGCRRGAGEPSSLVHRVAFSGGLALGGTWPSLKETHLHWCAYCYWFLFMVFKQLMQVLTAFPFSSLRETFYFGKISKDQQSREAGREVGSRQAWVWHQLNPSKRGPRKGYWTYSPLRHKKEPWPLVSLLGK